MENVFNKAFVDPAMLQYERNILPSISQTFADANMGSSSALNQALAQSGTDLATMLGSQYGNFYQNQQQNQLRSLEGLSSLLGQRTLSPMIHQQEGLLGPILSATGQIGQGFAQGFGTRGIF
jgi:hypothetical protein